VIIFDSVFCVQSYSLKLMKLVSTHRLLWPHWSRIQEFLSKKEQMVRKYLAARSRCEFHNRLFLLF